MITGPAAIAMEGQGRRPERQFRPNMILARLHGENEQLALELLQSRSYLNYHQRGAEKAQHPTSANAELRRANMDEYRRIKRRESWRRKHGVPLNAPVQRSGPRPGTKKSSLAKIGQP